MSFCGIESLSCFQLKPGVNRSSFIVCAKTQADDSISEPEKPKGFSDADINPKTGNPYKRPAHVRAAISKANKGKPKDYPSHLLGKRGKNHPSYKHGQGSLRDQEKDKLQAWALEVKKIYNFQCFLTGTSDDLQSHHLEGWSKSEEKRYDVSNGVCLAKPVHKQFHNIYGLGDNTTEQFEQFILDFYPHVAAKYEYPAKYPWNQDSVFLRQTPFVEEVDVENMKDRQKTHCEKAEIAFHELTHSRNHEWVSGEYLTVYSPCVVRCNIHNQEFSTTFRNYKGCRTGLKCCGSVLQSIANEARRDPNTGRFL